MVYLVCEQHYEQEEYDNYESPDVPVEGVGKPICICETQMEAQEKIKQLDAFYLEKFFPLDCADKSFSAIFHKQIFKDKKAEGLKELCKKFFGLSVAQTEKQLLSNDDMDGLEGTPELIHEMSAYLNQSFHFVKQMDLDLYNNDLDE